MVELDNPIFIIGAQRSGTTLLRLLLNAGPDIAIPEEGTFFMPLLRAASKQHLVWKQDAIDVTLRYIESNPQFKLWNVSLKKIKERFRHNESVDIRILFQELYREYAVSEGKIRWGDKTPSFFRMIPILAQLFPSAKFVHIVRDGRDLYLSWKKMDSSRNNPAVTAFEWRYKVDKAMRDMQKYATGRYLEIRYEDLVEKPYASLSGICKFCGLKYSDKMFDYWMNSDKYIGSHHSELIFQKVSGKSVGKWMDVCGKEKHQIKIFEAVSRSILDRYNYSINTDMPGLREKIAAVFLLLFGLPKRGGQVLFTKLILDFSMKYGRSTTLSGGEP